MKAHRGMQSKQTKLNPSRRQRELKYLYLSYFFLLLTTLRMHSYILLLCVEITFLNKDTTDSAAYYSYDLFLMLMSALVERPLGT